MSPTTLGAPAPPKLRIRVGFFFGMLDELSFFFGEGFLGDGNGKSNRDDRLKELAVGAKAVLDSEPPEGSLLFFLIVFLSVDDFEENVPPGIRLP